MNGDRVHRGAMVELMGQNELLPGLSIRGNSAERLAQVEQIKQRLDRIARARVPTPQSCASPGAVLSGERRSPEREIVIVVLMEATARCG